MKELADQYEAELRTSVIPFWEKFSPDRELGGFFSCLDRDGSVYDTEKFIWMQWRTVWMFAELFSSLDRNQRWLELARGGYEFLTRHGTDAKGRYYFSLARDGTPATAPYNVYSDCFAAMGAAAMFRATGEPRMRDEAMRAFASYESRKDRPKGEWDKTLPGRRAMRKMGYYMMQINLALVFEDCFGGEEFRPVMQRNIDVVLQTFWNEKLGLLMEFVAAEGSFDFDSMIGRHIVPGHAAEAVWMILDAAERIGDRAAIDRAADILLRVLEFSWDKQFGGIFYFMDALGKPHGELSWDMKLWWPHCEMLVALATAYRLTRREEFREWFIRVHEWTWSHFPDREFDEWFGYLNRRGETTHTLKGGKWKAFFHLPRALLLCAKNLRELNS